MGGRGGQGETGADRQAGGGAEANLPQERELPKAGLNAQQDKIGRVQGSEPCQGKSRPTCQAEIPPTVRSCRQVEDHLHHCGGVEGQPSGAKLPADVKQPVKQHAGG